MAPSIDVLVLDAPELRGSAEFDLGVREFRRRVSAARWWHVAAGGAEPSPASFPAWSDAAMLLVVVDPAVLVSDGIVEELRRRLGEAPGLACVLPADPRGGAPGFAPDYASRPGFDRFVRRLARAEPLAPYDGRAPWLYLVAREALEGLAASGERDVAWADLPARLGERAAIAQRAFVHSYANYHQGDRAEMLRLLPPEVRSLLDVGGGQGGFASAFAARTGGRAVLVEAHPAAAAAARVRGVETICEAFEAATIARGFDCVSFLDVLEHLPDPLAALRKAHSVLVDGGRLLLSVPNVGHWSVVRDLIEGEFDYQPVGILCNTHLRFFTRRSLERLLADAGFRVERWEDVPPPPAGPSAQPAAAALPADLARLLGERGGAPIVPDARSLATESFHVLARRD